MKNVMKRAWEIYRVLVGDKAAKLSMALKQAWYEIKRGAANMVELTGSEKQIKWAKDLVEKMMIEVNVWTKAINEADYKEETRQKALNQIGTVKSYMLNIVDAGQIIKEFRDFTSELDRVDNMKSLVRKLNESSSINRAIESLKF